MQRILCRGKAYTNHKRVKHKNPNIRIPHGIHISLGLTEIQFDLGLRFVEKGAFVYECVCVCAGLDCRQHIQCGKIIIRVETTSIYILAAFIKSKSMVMDKIPIRRRPVQSSQCLDQIHFCQCQIGIDHNHENIPNSFSNFESTPNVNSQSTLVK